MTRLALLCLCLVACDDGASNDPSDAAPPGDARLVDTALVDAAAPDMAPPDMAPDMQIADSGPVDMTPDAAPPSVATCVPDPPAVVQLPPGENEDGPWLTVGGRQITPAGPNRLLPGFPTSVVVHPDRGVAYITSTSTDDRRILVLDLETQRVRQDVERVEAFFGMALSPDGATLYASAGEAGAVDVFTVLEDGTLMLDRALDTGGYPAGIAVSPDGATLWVGLFDAAEVIEIEIATGTITRTLPTAENVWDVLHLPDRQELYTSTLDGAQLSVIDLAGGGPAVPIPVPTSPAGMARGPDGRVLVAVSGADVVAAIDPTDRTVPDWVAVAEADFTGPGDAPLGNSNVNAVAVDAATNRLYISRGADNAVSVHDATTLERIGALPTAWYPSDVALAGDTLVVIEGKGGGAGPNEGRSAKAQMKGSVTLVDLPTLDLGAASAQVRVNYGHPRFAFPFECDARFPIPTRPGQRSPIQHVVLIVKENKTFDCVLGDLDDPRADTDPSLVRYGEEITPNMHALARQFAISDNFYTEVQNSDGGHIMLTSGHLTEFAERMWIEKARTGQFQGFQIGDPATPDHGNLFTHLIDHDIDIQVYGEIVGMFIPAADGTLPVAFSDQLYPGGAYYNTGVADELKARHVAAQIAQGKLAQFTFLLLPTDHTEGTRPGSPTPESMVADNDYAMGLVIEALANSPFWPRTAIFVLQDDTQGCNDHVDAHRSLLAVVSPYGRRDHISHVHVSMVSVIATILRILDVPPLGRPDAAATPLWDMFTDAFDRTGYTAIPRRVPEAFNPERGPGSKKSARMRFHSPDRNPELGVILDAYRLWRMGRISRAEADARIARPQLSEEDWEELEEEAEEETTAFDRSWRRFTEWRQRKGLAPIRLR